MGMTTEELELTQEEIEADRSPDNAGNPVAVSRKKKAAKGVEKSRKELLSSLLATSTGRDLFRFLIFELCGIHATTENAAYDTNGMHYREGARQVGYVMQKMCIDANAAQYATLFKEHITKDAV